MYIYKIVCNSINYKVKSRVTWATKFNLLKALRSCFFSPKVWVFPRHSFIQQIFIECLLYAEELMLLNCGVGEDS